MILRGDCIEVMRAIKPNSVDAVVCDPPYGLEFMGKEWDKLDVRQPGDSNYTMNDTPHGRSKVRHSMTPSYGSVSTVPMQLWHTQWLTEAYRVLKPGGSMLVMGGTRTFHRLMVAIEDSGFIIKDCLMWIYGSGFPKAQDLGKMIDKRAGKKGKKIDYIAPDGKKRWGGNTFSVAEPPDGRGVNTKTLPSTDLAKHWDGFKVGGIKPAYENITWAYKPLTDIGLFGIMVRKIKELLCLIQKSNMTEEEKTNEARKTPSGTNQHGTEEQVVSSEVMDTLWSEFTKRNMDLNTVSSWKNTLEESLKDGNTFITEMVLSTITDLKILNCLLFQNIELNARQNTAKGKKTGGEKLNASIVVDILIGVLAKLSFILTSSTIEPAISQEDGQDSHLKPNLSPIVWAVKPPEGSYIDNVLKWGVGAVNVDECRVESMPRKTGTKPTSEKRTGSGASLLGSSKNRQAEWDLQNKGRFPANVILDEEAGRVMDEQSGDTGQRVAGGYKPQSPKFTGRDYNDGKIYEGDKRLSRAPLDIPSGASRFFYCAKASRGERNRGLEGMEEKESTKQFMVGMTDVVHSDGYKRTNQPIKATNNHPTVKPIALFEWLIKLVTREGQIVFDPFLGSGTTAIAAHKAGRECVGIEREDDYVEIAKRRIEYWESQPVQMDMNL